MAGQWRGRADFGKPRSVNCSTSRSKRCPVPRQEERMQMRGLKRPTGAKTVRNPCESFSCGLPLFLRGLWKRREDEHLCLLALTRAWPVPNRVRDAAN